MNRKETVEFLEKSLIFYNKLSLEQKDLIINSSIVKKYIGGTILIRGGTECAGLVIVRSGQIRAYTVSEEGKEITLYRLIDGDICIMSASCMLKDLNFSISLNIENDSELVIIPTKIFEGINEHNIDVKSFTLNLVSSRFTDVMWVLQQYVFQGMAKRLANALLEQSTLNDTEILSITHDELARDLGSAREVITRLLKQFSDDGYVSLRRGKIKIIDMKALRNI